MKLLIADVDLGECKSFVVSRAFLKRLQEYIENDIPLPEPRCITPRALDSDEMCQNCNTKWKFHDPRVCSVEPPSQ